MTQTTPQAAGAERQDGSGNRILEVTNLVKHYPLMSGGVIRRRVGDVHAACDLTFHLDKGETLGLVGESGCGKSTTGKAILQLSPPTSGSVKFEGQELVGKTRKQMRSVRRDLQVVFQDPYASLNPRIPVNDIVAEPLIIHGLFKRLGRERVRELLTVVGLNPEHGNRYAHEFSGGQRQRIGIARALALEPKVLVLDEPAAGIPSDQAVRLLDVIELLPRDMAIVMIEHDMQIVRRFASAVTVLVAGTILMTGSPQEVMSADEVRSVYLGQSGHARFTADSFGA